MFRDILLGSRAILAGLVFFVLIVGGSLLYSWHVHRTVDSDFAETQHTIQRLKNKNETHTGQDIGVPTDAETLGETQTPIVSDDMPEAAPVAQGEQPITNYVPVEENNTNPDFEDLSEETQIIRESQFGFGTYPEIPTDYPDQDIWDRIENMADESLARDNELMARVRIKLWNQGTQTTGASYDADKRKIYPCIPGIAYVTWQSVELSDGTHRRYASRVSGTPEIAGKERYFYELGVAPPGITVVSHEEGGVNPYDFLNLPR